MVWIIPSKFNVLFIFMKTVLNRDVADGMLRKIHKKLDSILGCSHLLYFIKVKKLYFIQC